MRDFNLMTIDLAVFCSFGWLVRWLFLSYYSPKFPFKIIFFVLKRFLLETWGESSFFFKYSVCGIKFSSFYSF